GQTISLSATGGGTYLWSGPSGFTSNVQNPSIPSSTTAMGGVYTVTVTTNGCTATATTSVTVNPTPTPTASNAGAYCPGQTISLSATGGGTYNWNGPNNFTSTNQNPQITSATTIMGGVYTVTVTANSCTAIATTSVVVNATPSITASNTGPYCPGVPAQLNASGGGTYNWSGPNGFTSNLQNPTLGNATTTLAGVYNLTVTLNSCTAIASTSVVVNSALTPGLSSNSPVCVGASLNLLCSNGVSWSWTGPNGFSSSLQNPIIPTATTLNAGTYSATVTDALGCSGSGTIAVIVNPLPVAVANNSGPFCEGGTVSLSSTGGTSYVWSGPNNFSASTQNPNIINASTLMSGIYTVTVTLNTCTATATTSVTVNPLPLSTASNSGPYCVGSSIALSAGGGGTYLWSGPGGFTSTNQNQTISSSTTAMSGLYTVTVTLNGCTSTATTSVTVNPLPIVSVSNTGPYCVGSTISLSTTGGGTYNWVGPNGFASTQQNPSIPSSTTAMSGNYSVTVTLNGCTATATNSVTVNAIPLATANNTGPYCLTTPVVLNGGGGGTYSWSGPNGFTSTQQSSSVGAATTALSGLYTVTVTSNGCTSTATTSVVVNTSLIPSLSSNSPVCSGSALTLGCSNGVSWNWTGPNGFTSTNQNPSINPTTSLSAGTYSVSVTDANGCIGTGTISVVINPLPILTVNTDSVCLGQGNAVLNASGANTYSWSGGTSPNVGSTVTASPSTTTVYTLTGVDVNGCINIATTTVTVLSLPNVTVNSASVCAPATATLTANGANTYVWSNGTGSGNTIVVNPNSTSTYSVTGTDANGCTAIAISTVTVNSQLFVDAGNNDTVCIGSNVSLVASGTPAGTSFVWSPGNLLGSSQTFNASIASTTIYTVTATDANGCTGVDSVTIIIPPAITLNATGFAALCNGVCDGQLAVIPSPNTGPFSFYSYNWQPGNYSSPSVINMCPGTYTVTVSNNAGCISTATVSVGQPTALTSTLTGVTDATCNGVCDGSATLTLNGGTPPYSYSWSNGSFVPNPSNLCSGLNTCNWQDANGCLGTSTVTINQPQAISVSIPTVSTICIGES
ncbi:MAG: hypothetical protein ACK5D5_02020, partial [Bacteroidota bacterium]